MSREDWLILGLIAGIPGAALLVASGAFSSGEDAGWVYCYQTLLAALAAIAVGALTVRAIGDQIAAASKDTREQISAAGEHTSRQIEAAAENTRQQIAAAISIHAPNARFDRSRAGRD